MTSVIDNQVETIQRLVIPVGTGVATNTSPSLAPLKGALAYDNTTLGVLYIGDGTNWLSAGSTGTNSVTPSNTVTLTNKTINSASNTLTITSGSLSGTNINNVLNQALLTTSSPTFVGVTLQTSGGTPAALNYYEAGTFPVTWTGAINDSSTARFVRIGSVVTVSIDTKSSAAVAAAIIAGVGQIPARLRPTALGSFWPIFVLNNSAIPTTPGRVQFNNSGDIGIALDGTAASFTNSGNCGFFSFSVTYNIN